MTDSERRGLLEELVDQRTGLLNGMTSPRGWTDDQMQRLAHTQMAIAALEAHGPMRLTKQQRLILLNQYRILSKFYPGEAKHYENFAAIVERGYEGLYSHLTEWLYDPMSDEDCREVLDILSMFRAITNSAATLDIKIPHGAEFDGFDGNTEDQYGFAKFFIEDMGRFDELKKGSLNSHSTRLPKYRAMLAAWKAMGESTLTEAQINELAKAR